MEFEETCGKAAYAVLNAGAFEGLSGIDRCL